MDRQFWVLRQRFAANRFGSTMVILATLTLGILIGTVVSGAVKGNQQNSSADATPLKFPIPSRCRISFPPSPATLNRPWSTSVPRPLSRARTSA